MKKLIEGTAIIVFWLLGMIQVASLLARYIDGAFASIVAVAFAVYVAAKVLGDPGPRPAGRGPDAAHR
jgi:hypothetical protein